MPIKRNAHIMVLSRDHHAGLLFGWKIKEGIKRGKALRRINAYIGFFWDTHLKDHFGEEERLLFCLVDNELTRKAKQEHEVLKARIKIFSDNEVQSIDEYISFADLLISHICFEERELFPFLESELPSQTLAGIGEALAKLHQSPYIERYGDEFWVDRAKKALL